MAYCDYAIDGADTIDRDWLFRFCTDWQARAAIDQSTRQAAPEAPYRVAEFWSSANPGKKVRMLAEGSDIVKWAKRSDFIRWVDASVAAPEAPAAATDQPSAGQDERAAFEAWANGRVTSLIQGKFGTGYVYADAARAWEAWQVARASLIPTAPQAASQQGQQAVVMECVKAVSIGYTDTNHMTEELHCADCKANLDGGDDHKPDCLTLRARAFLAPQAATTASASKGTCGAPGSENLPLCFDCKDRGYCSWRAPSTIGEGALNSAQLSFLVDLYRKGLPLEDVFMRAAALARAPLPGQQMQSNGGNDE